LGVFFSQSFGFVFFEFDSSGAFGIEFSGGGFLCKKAERSRTSV